MNKDSKALTLRPQQSGDGVLRSLSDLAAEAIEALSASSEKMAFVGRVRGLGPGVSFSQQIQLLERDHPRELVYPFEGSDRVGGAAWRVPAATRQPAAVAKLRWLDNAVDLPMHVHEHSDRCIIVLDGRGFFHYSHQSFNEFDGSSVFSVAARQHDVFVFARGLVHTFSTGASPMTLISVQLPFVEFNDPQQYSVPHGRWTAREHLTDCTEITISGWQQLVG